MTDNTLPGVTRMSHSGARVVLDFATPEAAAAFFNAQTVGSPPWDARGGYVMPGYVPVNHPLVGWPSPGVYTAVISGVVASAAPDIRRKLS